MSGVALLPNCGLNVESCQVPFDKKVEFSLTEHFVQENPSFQAETGAYAMDMPDAASILESSTVILTSLPSEDKDRHVIQKIHIGSQKFEVKSDTVLFADIQ